MNVPKGRNFRKGLYQTRCLWKFEKSIITLARDEHDVHSGTEWYQFYAIPQFDQTDRNIIRMDVQQNNGVLINCRFFRYLPPRPSK